MFKAFPELFLEIPLRFLAQVQSQAPGRFQQPPRSHGSVSGTDNDPLLIDWLLGMLPFAVQRYEFVALIGALVSLSLPIQSAAKSREDAKKSLIGRLLAKFGVFFGNWAIGWNLTPLVAWGFEIPRASYYLSGISFLLSLFGVWLAMFFYSQILTNPVILSKLPIIGNLLNKSESEASRPVRHPKTPKA